MYQCDKSSNDMVMVHFTMVSKSYLLFQLIFIDSIHSDYCALI